MWHLSEKISTNVNNVYKYELMSAITEDILKCQEFSFKSPIVYECQFFSNKNFLRFPFPRTICKLVSLVKYLSESSSTFVTTYWSGISPFLVSAGCHSIQTVVAYRATVITFWTGCGEVQAENVVGVPTSEPDRGIRVTSYFRWD